MRPRLPPSSSRGPPTAAKSAKSRPLNGIVQSRSEEAESDEESEDPELPRSGMLVALERRRSQRTIDLHARVLAVEPTVVSQVGENPL